MILSCTTRPPPSGVSRDVCTVRRHGLFLSAYPCRTPRVSRLGGLRLPLRDMLVLHVGVKFGVV